ncbi:hypothetical protein LTR66_002489 [Elasticomyces elasticus]|nr:hypothetical protein LTR66_002489 [Elasticomyces elasticus]
MDKSISGSLNKRARSSSSDGSDEPNKKRASDDSFSNNHHHNTPVEPTPYSSLDSFKSCGSTVSRVRSRYDCEGHSNPSSPILTRLCETRAGNEESGVPARDVKQEQEGNGSPIRLSSSKVTDSDDPSAQQVDLTARHKNKEAGCQSGISSRLASVSLGRCSSSSKRPLSLTVPVNIIISDECSHRQTANSESIRQCQLVMAPSPSTKHDFQALAHIETQENHPSALALNIKTHLLGYLTRSDASAASVAATKAPVHSTPLSNNSAKIREDRVVSEKDLQFYEMSHKLGQLEKQRTGHQMTAQRFKEQISISERGLGVLVRQMHGIQRAIEQRECQLRTVEASWKEQVALERDTSEHISTIKRNMRERRTKVS